MTSRSITAAFLASTFAIAGAATARAEQSPQPSPPAARSAAPDLASLRAEMKKLDFLAGTWEGLASIDMGPRGKHEVRQTETVEWKLGGTALLVQGLGVEKEAVTGAEKTVHEALGVITPDLAAGPGRYRFHAWLANGASTDAEARLENGVLTWGFTYPRGGKVRYTIRLDGQSRWSEIGETSQDGATWSKFFEMTAGRK